MKKLKDNDKPDINEEPDFKEEVIKDKYGTEWFIKPTDPKVLEFNDIKAIINENSNDRENVFDVNEDINKIQEFINDIKNFNEKSVFKMPQLKTDFGSKMLYKHVLHKIEKLTDETKYYDGQLIREMSRQIYEAHVSYALEFSESKYLKALDYIRNKTKYESLKVAYNDIKELINKKNNKTPIEELDFETVNKMLS